MSGLILSQKTNLKWTGASAIAVFASVGVGIGLGPKALMISSVVGLVFAAISYFLNRKQWLAFALAFVHLIFFGAGFGMQSLLLSPLGDDVLQMPRLSEGYESLDGFFQVKVPEGWAAEAMASPTELGVRMRPVGRDQYMGVSELTVRIRELENPTSDPVDFLRKMAETLSLKTEKDKTLFNFSTEPTRLLSGKQGVWSKLHVKRFWVPLYQLTLFGIKGDQYLCTVSSMGLEAHSTLAEVLSLGVYETIQVSGPKKSQKKPRNP